MEALDEIWSIFAFWTSVLVIKLLLFTWFTGRYRVFYKVKRIKFKNSNFSTDNQYSKFEIIFSSGTQVIHSEEDKQWMEGSDIILNPSGGGHPEVDRIRSAHHSNLEATLLFTIIFPLWALCYQPSVLIFRFFTLLFVLSRFLYSILQTNLLEMPSFYQLICFSTNYSVLFVIVSLTLYSFL